MDVDIIAGALIVICAVLVEENARLSRMFVDWLIRRAMRTPYFHLYHADGSLYMERFWLIPFANAKGKDGCYVAKWYKQPFVWLLQRFDIAVRLHHIATPDFDRVLHDHPWNFVSVVLRGGYSELRPLDNARPCYDWMLPPVATEACFLTTRAVGDVCLRRATDRHKILGVESDTWTLFISGPRRQWWGFYTPKGKIHHRDYEIANKEATK